MPDTRELLKKLQAERPVRTITIDRSGMTDDDLADRTVSLAFASDTPCDHWFGELSLSMKGMRTDRLDAGCALLMDHDWTDQVGIVDSYSTDKTTARAVVRFSKSKRGEEIYQDVLDGIRKSVSVGFMLHDIQLESEQDGICKYVSNDWEPYEISIVSVPADISVGVGRSKEVLTKQAEESAEPQPTEKTHMETIETPAGTPAVEKSAAQRHAELAEFAAVYGQRKAAEDLLLSNPDATLDDIRELVRQKREPQIETPKPTAEELANRQKGTQLAIALPRHAALKNFKGEKAAERAYRFGKWVQAGPMKDARAAQFCQDHGIAVTRALSEGQNEYGGFLVPEEFGNDLIDLREQYGVFRQFAKVVPMASDTRTDPRRTGGLTAYFVNEGDAITASLDKSWDRVSLTAKKLACLARVSSELNEDSVISLGDDLAGEMAYAFANKEDECGFNGDGTSTYGGIVGVREKIKGLSGTIANIAGLQVGTGNAYSELVLADFEGVVALLPQYADTPNARWFVHRTFYYNVMLKLALAAGGVTKEEIVNGQRIPTFLGYPVAVTQVMPKVEANSQVCAVLGDLALAASLGSRRDVSIAMSEHSRFGYDQIEFRGTQRFDINVHSVGNASATAGSRVAGPIVGLITAAS